MAAATLATMFLFHTGSIKRFMHIRVRLVGLSFYSILVRLKAHHAGKQRPTSVRFLFHTGSIKSEHVIGCDGWDRILFLFHTGSIKRPIQ